MEENVKYSTIKDVVDGKIKKKRASVKLDLSIRQINRLIRKYRDDGKTSFIHGNRNRKPVFAKPEEFSKYIIDLYKDKYYDSNFEHFKEFLEEREEIKVSYNYIRTTLASAGILSPKAHRKTRKKHSKAQKEKLKASSEEQEVPVEETLELVNKEIPLEDSHPRQEKPKYAGEEVQMDASEHIWFNNLRAHLHAAIDYSSGNVTGAYFSKQETLDSYYNITRQTFINFGIPYKFKTDNRTIFNYFLEGKSSAERDTFTQFGFACKTLGIELETTSVPQAKGVIERLFGTFQSRLIVELRLANIKTIEEANEFLIPYIPKYNSKFGREIKENLSVFESPPSLDKINQTLAIVEKRIINGSSITFNSKSYQLYINDQLICFPNKTECLVIECFDKTLLSAVGDIVYQLKELKTHKETSENFDEPVIESKPKRKWKPPTNHPWKMKKFNKHFLKEETENV